MIEWYKINRINEIKYLGVILDQYLDIKSHYNYIISKMSNRAYLLKIVGKPMSLAHHLFYK